MKNTTMNNAAMNTAINTILENIGNNPEAMKALMAAIAETTKVANEPKTEQAKKACRYIICLERVTVKGEKVYHPFVMTPPTAKTPKMLIVDNAVKAQDVAQTYGMRIRDNVYAMPATEAQIKKLTELLKECNARIVNAVNAAVRAVGMVSTNINTDVLCAQYMRQLMENCKGVIGASMTKDSEIIEKDIKVIHPTRTVAVNNCCDCGCCDYDDEDYDDCDDDCDYCDCGCCSHHPSNF
jgi:hypothetical protein